MSALTDWFPAGVKPARIGAYEVDDEDGMSGWFAWWNGTRFCYRSTGPESASTDKRFRTDCKPLVKWRGLAFDPSVPA